MCMITYGLTGRMSDLHCFLCCLIYRQDKLHYLRNAYTIYKGTALCLDHVLQYTEIPGVDTLVINEDP